MSERKIVDYHTAEGADSVILRENIRTLFDEGYVLYGNPYPFKDQENEIYLCQAMVKYGDTKTSCEHTTFFELCNLPKFNYLICRNCGDIEKRLKDGQV
jgi:hypothetical protein